MDPTDVIDSYVRDVARRLPPGKRDDVALELRTLLADDLLARAEAAGRGPDQEMAVAMLREFGRPAEVSVRYYQPFTVIGPADTGSFLIAAVAGGALVGLLAPFWRGSMPSAALAQSGNLAFLAWLGILVVVFGLKSLVLRRRPDAFAWRPRPVRDTDSVNRAAAVALGLGWLVLLVCYLVPGSVAELVSGGRLAAGTLAYSDSFTTALRMPWLAGVLIIAVGLQLVVAVRGHWRPGLRWAQIAVIALIGTQLGWHASYGSILADPDADRVAVPVFGSLSVVVLVACGILIYREYNRVRPATATGSLV